LLLGVASYGGQAYFFYSLEFGQDQDHTLSHFSCKRVANSAPPVAPFLFLEDSLWCRIV